ncbi:Uma2 family endonuclease [Dolichospermum sp. ST_con]|nr:Uma2 family endonuclease [Dolichospermum sp. ST_con]MDD1419665.1 Uma2 family endonuclease [Dolichospermum sp. ST_sed1]MDD1425299.1 Uma2 family endonuclease [Dolichospermum sp. ST_sed9]MDD1431664.1 Uma2 family endonuclease [Dolichospermum sp. ST_sed6]MDD1437035.1 Uma2 family endonuclease [Dolichospermum sp. ST_sed10]MDD1440877.1 Uma2 family endonuclease [Dolichospermum sp. ST_sed3]MDD1444542.1 Uma2 family endonuclease [Dolichospermum sp. ST_sed8]MDD1457424.1 Uma2 family endonuclease [Dolic
MLGLLEKLNQWEELTSQSILQNVDSDQILLMNGIGWNIYETILKRFENTSHYRFKYLEGTLEIMSPSRRHEFEKKIIALLLETYFIETDIDFYPLGSTTFRKEASARGIEPDECYCFNSEKSVPDLAIEVVVTSGGINDLLIYQGLGVPEVWFWQNYQFSLYHLRGDQYEKISKSVFLPDLDLDLLASLILSGEKPKDLISKFRESIRSGNS